MLTRKTAPVTSRIPRDTPLRLVPRRPLATARRAATVRRSRPPRPPEGIPALPELARRARAELADAVRLARWADAETGAAAPGTAGILRDPDVLRAAAALCLTERQVRTAWDRARLTGLIELHKGGAARPGWRLRAWDRDDTAVLRGWVALFDAWSLAHPAALEPECADADPSLVAEVVEAAPQLLSLLHLSSGPVAVAVLLDLLRQRVAELRAERHEPPADGGRDELPALLDWTLDALARVGALRPRDPARPGEVTITALGSWAVWVKLEQICVAAQGPAGHFEHSAEEMLKACIGMAPGAAREVLKRPELRAMAWILGSVVLFGLLLQPLGLVMSLAVLVMVSSFASHEFGWKGALLNTVILIAFSVGVFIRGIHLQIGLWPAFLG